MNLTERPSLTYLEFGLAEGEVVFFFHGWPGSAKQGVFLDEVARKLNLRIIAINRPGICGSRFIPNRQLNDWPASLTEITNKLKITKYSMIAVSGGAPYALACAAENSPLLDKVLIVCGAPLFAVTSSSTKLLWIYRLLIALFRFSPKFLECLIEIIRVFWPLKLHLIFLKVIAWTLPKKDQDVLSKPQVLKLMIESMEDQILPGAKVLLTDAQIYLDPPGFDLTKITKQIIWWHGLMDKNIPVQYPRALEKIIPNFILEETVSDGHFSIAINEVAKIVEQVWKR